MSKPTGEWDDSLIFGGYSTRYQIQKGARLRIVRKGEPDVFVIVEDVKEDGPAINLTVRSE